MANVQKNRLGAYVCWVALRQTRAWQTQMLRRPEKLRTKWQGSPGPWPLLPTASTDGGLTHEFRAH